MREHIKEWIANNSLDAVWLDDKTFTIADKKYFCIGPKEGRLFDEEFKLIKSVEESEESLLAEIPSDFYCFTFGGKVYYSSCIQDKVDLNPLKYLGSATDLSGYPYLGVHGGYELCSGSRKYEDWCKKAQFLSIQALGLTEKHTLAGALKFQMACSKAKIKPILGETITVRVNKEDYKVKIYVKNEEGWKNLLKIHKRLNVDNLSSCVEEEYLLEHNAGLAIVFCADTMLARDCVERYAGADIYYQYDPVQYKSHQRDVHCLECLKNYLKNFLGILPVVLITDSYYLDKEESSVRKLLSFIGKGEFQYQSDDQYFKTLEDVAIQSAELFTTKGEGFAVDVLEYALEGLDALVSKCDFKIKTGEIHLPEYQLSEEEIEAGYTNIEDLFWDVIDYNVETKIKAKGKDVKVYLERIASEYDVISRGGFQSYFLILRDIINWCERNDVLVGTARGSAAGSLIAYLLNIVRVDPLEYDLIFERFLNESRIGKGLPDIDTDFQSERREDVKRYMEQRFGASNVASIGTYTGLKTKASFHDLLRFYGEESQVIHHFAGMIDKSSDDYSTLFVAATQNVKLKEFIDKHLDAVQDIPLILGQPKSASVHAAGVIISPTANKKGEPMQIWDWFPCKIIDGILISEWEGVQLDDYGVLKADILGLSQLDKLAGMLDLIEARTGERINLNEIDTKDANVFEHIFKKGLTQDIFQFGTDGLSAYCREVKPETVEELAVMNALYRPGPMNSGAHTDYVKIKFGKKEAEYDYGCEELLQSTFGLLVFQEQAIRMVQKIGGFSLTDGDGVRKCLHGDTLMWTDNGYFKISELVGANKNLLTFNQINTINKINQAERIFYSGKKECIKINFVSGREIICTPDHKVWTNYGWIEAKDLTIEHFGLHELQEKYGNVSVDRARLYLIVALITEGYIPEGSSCRFVNKDTEEIELFVTYLKEVFGDNVKYNIQKDSKDVISVNFSHKLVIELGIKFGKSVDKELPDYFLRLKKEDLLFVISKLIDFDGWIDSKGQIYYTSKSKKLCQQVHFLIECTGVKAGLSSKVNKQYGIFHDTFVSDSRDINELHDKLTFSKKVSSFKNSYSEKLNFTRYIVPNNIWLPIVEDLINNSGYTRHELIGSNVSGSYFTSNLSIERLNAILSNVGRSKILDFFINKNAYWDQVKNIECVGGQDVYDFTMSSDRTPQAYANGVLVHNSTGKKDLAKMQSYKEKFIDGAVRNGCKVHEAVKIWNKIEVFAEYSFNLSHAISYSLIGYQTAWIKYYYPLEFWTISLQYADDDEIPKRVSELRKFDNINLFPPEINKSRSTFYTDWNIRSIYWSLNRIKQVGTVALEAITKDREENGFYFSLEEFVTRMKGRSVNSRVVKHLIFSGCFDEMYNIDNPLSRKKIMDEFQKLYGVKEIPEYEGQNIYQEFFWYKLQRNLSGFGFFDYSQLVDDLIFEKRLYVVPDQIQLTDNLEYEVVVAGILVDYVRRKTKKGEMGKLTIDHNNDLIDVVLWNDSWEMFKKDIEAGEGMGIMLNGTIKYDGYNKKNAIYSHDKTIVTLF